MNPKKQAVITWSCVFIISIILTILSFIGVRYGREANVFAVISAILLFWDVLAFSFWLTSFTFKYRRFYVDDYEIEIYVGFRNHYIKVDGDIKDEYISVFTLSPIRLEYTIAEHKIEAIISPTNSLTVKCDGELIRQFL